MPAWLIQIIVTLAIKFGIPFILKRFPGIPPEVIKIIEDLISKLTQHSEQKSIIVGQAKADLRKCIGDSCKL